jgi:hypothetical protein
VKPLPTIARADDYAVFFGVESGVTQSRVDKLYPHLITIRTKPPTNSEQRYLKRENAGLAIIEPFARRFGQRGGSGSDGQAYLMV